MEFSNKSNTSKFKKSTTLLYIILSKVICNFNVFNSEIHCNINCNVNKSEFFKASKDFFKFNKICVFFGYAKYFEKSKRQNFGNPHELSIKRLQVLKIYSDIFGVDCNFPLEKYSKLRELVIISKLNHFKSLVITY